jgi:hypothetical protein
MKSSLILAATLMALPAAASAHCSVHELNGSWTYYSVAGGTSPYTIACALQIGSGTITSGQCVSSDGSSLTATGSFDVAPPSTPAVHKGKHGMRPLSSVKHGVCTLTGTITYSAGPLTETLSNLTVTRDKDTVLGVGTNGTGLLSVSFVNTKESDHSEDSD